MLPDESRTFQGLLESLRGKLYSMVFVNDKQKLNMLLGHEATLSLKGAG